MSADADEDTELRDLVAQTLEANGVLGKIRVNMASIYINGMHMLINFFFNAGAFPFIDPVNFKCRHAETRF